MHETFRAYLIDLFASRTIETRTDDSFCSLSIAYLILPKEFQACLTSTSLFR